MTNEQNTLNDDAGYRAERYAESGDSAQPAAPAEITMSQADFDERHARRAAGHDTDEDRRLLKMYERDGWKPGARERDAGRVQSDDVARPTHAEDADVKASGGRVEEVGEWRGNSTGTSSGATSKSSGEKPKSAPRSAPSTASSSKNR